MFEALVVIFQISIIYVNCIVGRHSIAYVLIPLSSEIASRLDIKPEDDTMFMPCSHCFFKYNQAENQLVQYYNRPLFGRLSEACGCFEFVKKGFADINEQTPIKVSQNIMKMNVSIYYGVIKTEWCRLDSIRSARTVNGLQLAFLMRCS